MVSASVDLPKAAKSILGKANVDSTFLSGQVKSQLQQHVLFKNLLKMQMQKASNRSGLNNTFKQSNA